MEKLICPSCMGDFGVKSGMTGTNAHNCPECGDCYVVMYAAGFTDGVRKLKAEISTIFKKYVIVDGHGQVIYIENAGALGLELQKLSSV